MLEKSRFLLNALDTLKSKCFNFSAELNYEILKNKKPVSSKFQILVFLFIMNLVYLILLFETTFHLNLKMYFVNLP